MPGSSSTPYDAASLRRSFRIISITVGIFFAIYIMQAYSLYQRSVRSQKWVAHTNQVINRLEAVYSDIWQLQEVHRSLYSKDTTHPLHLTIEAAIRRDLDSLGRLTDDNPYQQDRLNRFTQLISQKVSY